MEPRRLGWSSRFIRKACAFCLTHFLEKAKIDGHSILIQEILGDLELCARSAKQVYFPDEETQVCPACGYKCASGGLMRVHWQTHK